MLVAGAAAPYGAGDADWEHSGGGEVEDVEVDLGHAPVEGDRLVCQREGERDGHLCVDEAELAGGDGDSGLAAAVDAVCRGGSGGGPDGDAEVDAVQGAGRAGELQFR